MKLRTATIIVCLVDAAAWVVLAAATYMSGSDPATRGLDQAAGLAVTALFVVTAVPALALALRRRGPATALTLALAFPAVLVVVLVVTVVAFA